LGSPEIPRGDSGKFRISNFEFRISAHPPGSRDGCPTISAGHRVCVCGARVSRAGRVGVDEAAIQPPRGARQRDEPRSCPSTPRWRTLNLAAEAECSRRPGRKVGRRPAIGCPLVTPGHVGRRPTVRIRLSQRWNVGTLNVRTLPPAPPAAGTNARDGGAGAAPAPRDLRLSPGLVGQPSRLPGGWDAPAIAERPPGTRDACPTTITSDGLRL
jgi:hypothetical protein